MQPKNWDEVIQHLQNGGELCVDGRWYFSEIGMDCPDGCCADVFEDIDDALQTVKIYAHGKLEKVDLEQD